MNACQATLLGPCVAGSGLQTAWFLRTPCPHQVCDGAVCPGRGGTPAELAAAVADEAYFQYERALQKEEEPELTITLPSASDSTRLLEAGANGAANGHDAGPAKSAFGALANGGPLPSEANGHDDAAAATLMPPPPTPGAGNQGSGAGSARTVTVRIEYDVRDPAGGMRFHGGYAMSDNQARFALHETCSTGCHISSQCQESILHPCQSAWAQGCHCEQHQWVPMMLALFEYMIHASFVPFTVTQRRVARHSSPSCCTVVDSTKPACVCGQVRRARAWCPCVDLPTGGCPIDAAVTVAGDQTAVASGQLVRQTRSAAAGTRTFHFRLARAQPPGSFALAVGAYLPLRRPCCNPAARQDATHLSSAASVTHRTCHFMAGDMMCVTSVS